MVVKLLMLVGSGVLSVGIGLVLWIAAVEDAGVVVGPRDAGELDLGQHLIVVLACKCSSI